MMDAVASHVEANVKWRRAKGAGRVWIGDVEYDGVSHSASHPQRTACKKRLIERIMAQHGSSSIAAAESAQPAQSN
jgi:hypothetical protein